MSDIHKILLIGNPNSGKSSLFNLLTGTYQKVANYPGVTTERKSGNIKLNDQSYEIIDLPGAYSLYPNSLDEKVVIDELIHQKVDLVIFVADAGNLARSLLLFTQVSDCLVPTIVVINMVDELKRKGQVIDIEFLKKELGTEVFLCNSKKDKGLDEVKNYIEQGVFNTNLNLFGNTEFFKQSNESKYLSYREWHQFVYAAKPNAIIENTKRIEIIDRYNRIEQIVNLTIRKTQSAFDQKRWTDKLDKWAIHPVYGYLILLGILFIVFQALFTIASYPMDWLESLFGWISTYFVANQPSSLWRDFVAEALIPGIGGVLIFIPQIALLFLLNTLLEESGYMARMVFLLDNLMRKFGLSGKSLMPLISGNACAIPAIASTKAIPTHKERLITILLIPFMTCSARLPVYTLLISITIPLGYQGLTWLGLYLLTTIIALAFGWILNKSIDTNEKSFLIMEMPPYRLPSLRNILTNIKNAVLPFVKTAGSLILIISIILWLLGSFNIQEGNVNKVGIEESVLASIGKTIEPTIRPLGYDWKIGVALLSSFAAREVFVSTLTTLYHIDSEESSSIFESIKSQTYPNTDILVFSTAVGVSLLLFYAFALQCMSTLAAIRKETGTWTYPLFSFVIMFILAYGFALVAYQVLK